MVEVSSDSVDFYGANLNNVYFQEGTLLGVSVGRKDYIENTQKVAEIWAEDFLRSWGIEHNRSSIKIKNCFTSVIYWLCLQRFSKPPG